MASTTSLVSELKSTVETFSKNVHTEAQKVDIALDKIDKTVNNVARKIKDLREMIIQGEEKQLAHENVNRIEQQINEQLKSYEVVRRSVLGVIKDFDINLVRNSTISQLSEELWMSSSRYWLSYAFIAISAWIKDNREICNNAINEALNRDPCKTALFFCLLNMRFASKDKPSRHIAAREWLYEYFGHVDSLHPPRETALLLQAYLYGVFGHDSQLDNFVQDTVMRWVDELNKDTSISADLVEKYNNYICNLPPVKHNYSSDILEDHCSNVKQMYASLSNAGRYKTALGRVEELDRTEEFNVGGDFIKSIDKLLDDLVTNYEEDEIKLRNEQKLYKLIMEHEGNVEAAKKEYAAYMETVKEAPNIGEQMFTWAVYPTGIDVSVQKFAMQKTKGWYMDAIKNYDHIVKSTAPGAFKLKIGLWESTTDGKDAEALKNDVKDKYMSERSRLLVYTKPNIIMAILAVAFLIVGCVVGFVGDPSWSFYGYIAGGALFLIFGGIVLATTLIKIKNFPKQIAEAQKTLEACLDAIELYRKKFAEISAVKDDVLNRLENI